MTQEALTTFFGWTTVFHFGILLFATLMMMGLRDWTTALHARMFDLQDGDVRQSIYNWLGTYKLLVFVFAFVPWLTLTIM